MSQTQIVYPLKNRFLTVGDLEQLLQLHRRTIVRLCKSGILPRPVKIGGSNRWNDLDVLAAIQKLRQDTSTTQNLTEESHGIAEHAR